MMPVELGFVIASMDLPAAALSHLYHAGDLLPWVAGRSCSQELNPLMNSWIPWCQLRSHLPPDTFPLPAAEEWQLEEARIQAGSPGYNLFPVYPGLAGMPPVLVCYTLLHCESTNYKLACQKP
jgi:hypothetical protein